MFQPLPFSIGLRYLRAKRRNGFISFISMASILGIIIGVIALITTIAVMSGFQQELRDRILGMVAHATVSGMDGPLQDWPKAVAYANQDKRVVGRTPKPKPCCRAHSAAAPSCAACCRKPSRGCRRSPTR